MIYSLCKTKKNGCIRSHPQQSEGVNEGGKSQRAFCVIGRVQILRSFFCLQSFILMEVLWY